MLNLLLWLLGILATSALGCYAWYYYTTERDFKLLRKLDPNAPSIVPLKRSFPLGSMDHFFAYDAYKYLKDEFQSAGFPSLRAWWVFRQPYYLVNDTNMAKELHSQPDSNFGRTLGLGLVDHLIGQGILGVEGETWAKQHRILYKAFSKKNIRALFDMINEEADRLIAKIKKSGAAPLKFGSLVNELALRIISRSSFGIDPDVDEDLKQFQDDFVYILKQAENPLHLSEYYNNLPLESNKRVQDALARMQGYATRLIEERRQRGPTNPARDSVFLLDLIMEHSNEESEETKLTDIEMRDNVIVFLLAGSETTAWSMAWFLSNMMLYPDVYRRVVDDVDQTLNGELLNVDHIDKSSYFIKALHESMRRTPVVALAAPRRVLKDTVIYGHQIPAGTQLQVNILGVQNQPNNWGDDWNSFNPEHFSEEASKNHHPYSFMPFGAGRRMCIGRNLADDEMKIVLMRLLSEFDISLAQPKEEIGALMKPPVVHIRNDLTLSFKPRVKSN